MKIRDRIKNRLAVYACLCLIIAVLSGCSFGKVKLFKHTADINEDVDYPVGQIVKGVVVTQSFVSVADRLDSIKLFGATYKRDNTATIDIKVYVAPAGSTVTEEQIATARADSYSDYDLCLHWSIDSSAMEDNTIILLGIDKSDSPVELVDYNADVNSGLTGRRCVIEISSPDGEPEQSPTFWMTEDNFYEQGVLNIYGYDQYNDIWFQVYGTK